MDLCKIDLTLAKLTGNVAITPCPCPFLCLCPKHEPATRTFYQYDWLDRITQITYPTVNGLTMIETIEYDHVDAVTNLIRTRRTDVNGGVFRWDVFPCFCGACFCLEVQGFKGSGVPFFHSSFRPFVHSSFLPFSLQPLTFPPCN